MKNQDIKKKKALSEKELLEVTGGNSAGGGIAKIECKDKKNPDKCAEIQDCAWNNETGKCEGEGFYWI